MSSLEYQMRVHNLLKRYQYNPELFDEKQVDELREIAKSQGIGTTKKIKVGEDENGKGVWEKVDIFDPKARETSEVRLKRIASQLQMGFVEGFTTIPVSDWTNKPSLNTYEAIAHSIGHLVGFAPGIAAAPIKYVAGKTLGKQAGLRAQQVVREMGEYSIPMLAGHKVQNLYETGLSKAGLDAAEFLKKGSQARNISTQAVHLGAASAASAVWKGPEAIMDSTIHGAIAGGAFGGIAEFTRLGNIMKNGTPKQVENAEKNLRTAVGATMMGLPSVVNKEPIEMVIYNTLLGGFFGRQGGPSWKMEGEKYMADLKYSDPSGQYTFRPKEHPEWNKYTKKVQDYILDGSPVSINTTARKFVLRNFDKEVKEVDLNNLTPKQQILNDYFIYEATQKFNTKNPTKEQIDIVYREKAHDMYMGKNFGYDIVEPMGKADPVQSNVEDSNDPVVSPATKPKTKEKTEAQKELDNSQVEAGVFTVDKDGTVHFGTVNGEMEGKLVGEKRIDRPIETMSSGNFVEVQYIRNHKLTTDRGAEVYKLENPLHSSIKDGEVVPSTSAENFWRMEYNLHKGNAKQQPMYFYSGVKDKTVLLAATYHLESIGPKRVRAEALIKELSGGDPRIEQEIRKSFEESYRIERDEWFQGKAPEESLREMHEMQWVSNVLYKSEAEGLYKTGSRDYTRLHEQFKGTGFAKDVVAFNKRMQLFNDKSYKLKLDGDYTYAIMNDKILDELGIEIGSVQASDTDGSIFYRHRVSNEISQAAEIPGLKVEKGEIPVAMNKPVIIVPGKNGQGTMVVKSAGQAAPAPLREYMRANNLDMIIMSSSAKYRGIRDVHDLFYNKETGEYRSSYDQNNPNHVLTMKKSDVRINLGTREDPKGAFKKQKFVKQLFSVINSEQTSPEMAQHVFDTYFLPQIQGKPEMNALANQYLKDGSTNLNKIKINDMDASLAYRIINKPDHKSTKHEKALKKRLLEEMYQIDKAEAEALARGENLDAEQSFNDKEWAIYNQKRKRIISEAGMGDGVRTLLKEIRRDESRKVMKYFIDRYVYPKYDYSAKAWLAPKMPHMDLRRGEFKADDSWNPKVQFDGVSTDLRTLWNIKRLKEGERLSSKSDYKHRKRTTEAKGLLKRINESRKERGLDEYKTIKDIPTEALEGAFEFTTIRVPADSISGVRVLKFTGFSGEKGISVYTHGKDNEYLGGADKDSDSAFFYQGFDKKTKDMFKKNQYEWQKNNSKDGEYTPAKDEKFNEIFLGKNWQEKQAPYKTPYSVFSPSMRKIVARSASGGNQGLGYGLVGRNIMIGWADVLSNPKNLNSKGEYEYEVIGSNGQINGVITLKLKEGGHEILRQLGREIVGRSADAADFPTQIPYSKFRDVMFEQAFEGNVKWTDKYIEYATEKALHKVNLDFNYDLIASASSTAPFKKIKAAIQLANSNPKQWNEQGPSSMPRDVYEAMINSVADSKHNFGNISQQIVNQIKKDGIHKYEAPDVDVLNRLIDIAEYHVSTATPNFKGVKDPKELIAKKKRWKEHIRLTLGGKYFNYRRPEKKGNESWQVEQFLDFIGKDIYNVASINKLAEQGFTIQEALIDAGRTDAKNSKKVIEDILVPIQDYAFALKQQYYNQHKVKGEESLKIDFRELDAAISKFKNEKLATVAQANKIDPKLLQTYFDLHLLSGYKSRGSFYDKPPMLSIQSQAISGEAVRGVLSEFNRIYNAAANKQISVEKAFGEIMQPIKRTKNVEIPEGKSTIFAEGDIVLDKGRISGIDSKKLDSEIKWEKGIVLGRKSGRDIVYFGEPGTDYTFSGTTYKPTEWTPELLKLKKIVEESTGVEFNSALVNRYKKGQKIGRHQDNEPELGVDPFIASVSFGETIRFTIDNPRTGQKIDIPLSNNDLLIMQGKSQKEWYHRIDDTPLTDQRINVTFRRTNMPQSEKYTRFKLDKATGSSETVENTMNVVEQTVTSIVPKTPFDNVKARSQRDWKVEDLGVTKEDFIEIEKLRNNLKDNPKFAENFEEWFPSWYKDRMGAFKEVDAMNMRDVQALNNYLEALTTRSKKFRTKVPNWVFRADPRTIDEHMAKFDGQLFSSFDNPVIQRGGNIKFKEVKVFMSTIGAMKEFTGRIHVAENSHIGEGAIAKELDASMPYRTKLNVKEAQIINDLVIMKREGLEYKDSEIFKANANKKFKEKTVEEWVESTDKQMTKFFNEFGAKWIYSKGKLGKDGRWENDKFIKYKSNGAIDMNHYFRTALEPSIKSFDVNIIPIETQLRFAYEYRLEQDIIAGEPYTKNKTRDQLRKSSKFKAIGKINPESYFPHMNFGATKAAEAEMMAWKVERVNNAYDQAISRGKSEAEAAEAAAMEMLKWDLVKESGNTLSHGIAKDVIDSIDGKGISFEQLANNMGLNKRNPNILDREFDMPGWDKSVGVTDMYYENVVRNHYKLIQAHLGNYQIDRMAKNRNFGKDTADWTFVMKRYLKDSLGHQTTFGDQVFNIMNPVTGKNEKVSDRMKNIFEKSFYNKMSDDMIVKGWDKVEKQYSKWGYEAPFLKNAPKVTAEKWVTDATGERKINDIWKQQTAARLEYQSRIIHELGRKEAKFELMTLLANSGTYVSNIYGGQTMNIASAGFRNVRRANSNKWLNENVIKNSKGEFHLELNEIDPVTKKPKLVTNTKELRIWLSEKGVIENFIQNELNINAEWRAELSKSGSNAKDFINEAMKIIKKNPDVSDATLAELARRYGIGKALIKGGSFFMASSERKLRQDSFLAHALQFRDAYGSMSKDLPLSDPAVMQAGLKGIEATQFLYHSAFRPAYMRTSLGKVMTRFKLFAFQSVRTRRELYRKARDYGFDPGTPAFERFKDLFLIDMMTFALGSAFQYSLFDTTLPPPYDWVQETAEWLYGDEKEREKAFFGTYPGVLAPLQVATPPIARMPMQVFTSLINNDWDRFMDYHLHTMYPFGRMIRQIDRTMYDPDAGDFEIINEQAYGTTLGRGMKEFFRLPTDKAVAIYDRKKLKADRMAEIGDNLNWLDENE